MSEKSAPSGAELVKEHSRQLRGTIADSLAAGGDRFEKTDVALLKFHGTYQQDDRDARKDRKPGENKSVRRHMFMVRSKIPGGRITARQFLTELDLAERHGNGTLRVTTRQGLQLHGVIKQNLKATIRSINDCLLSTLGACGDVNRNVMCCPAPHYQSAVHEQLQAAADWVAAEFAPRTRAYAEIWLDGERFQLGDFAGRGGPAEEPLYGAVYMPRKFKIGFGLCDDNCIDIYSNDLGFLAVVESKMLIGYNVLVGGGMGMTPSDLNTFPRLASRLAFVAPHAVREVATAVLRVQRDFGNRSDRKRARLKYLVHDWGVPAFKAKVEEYLGRPLADPHPADVQAFHDHLGWHPQGDGRYYYGINIENGRIQDTPDCRMKSALRVLFEQYAMPARLTPNQSILLCDLEPAWKDAIDAALVEHGVVREFELSYVRRYSMACPGLPTCGLSVTESERALPAVVDEFEQMLVRLGLDTERFALHMTGCPNGCARPYNSDIGLVGQTVDKYRILVGGRLDGTRLNFAYRELVPTRELIGALEPLFLYFKSAREPGESFGDFCHRKGKAELERFASVYRAA
jgi:sulfite reductase (ferredoxin)